MKPRHRLRLAGLCLSVALVSGPGLARDTAAEVALAKEVLRALQAKSIRRNREYCGYLGYDAEGRLLASRAQRGRAESCLPRWPDQFDPVASYHTHGGYDPDSWSEIPSGTDMQSDEADGIDGYISTPGGRLWFVDSSVMVARQICGVGCLPMDGDFEPETDIRVQQSYAYDELINILE